MRVYEVAKLLDVSSKDVIGVLKDRGIDAKSHMSVLTDEDVDFVTKALNKTSSRVAETAPPVTDKSKKTPSSAKSKIKNMQKVEKVGAPEVSSGKPSLSSGRIELEPMTVADFSERTSVPVTSVIMTLLSKGMACSRNDLLSESQVQELGSVYELEVCKKQHAGSSFAAVERVSTGVSRKPVVVVMGHVDHGKTSLLDYIRKTRVAAKEKGGITQHIGAYEAKTPHGSLIFLDTPGHAAFAKIRKRGASVADVAVLVVAADDGIMPQTVESIKAIKALNVPVVVAINKVDKVDEARLEVIKRQLTQYDLLPEEWGGDVVCVPVSAKEGTGIDHLLEIIALQSDLLELKAPVDVPAKGYVLEARLQKGRGPVATVICQQGTLKVGDFFIAGSVVGKVVSLVDSKGSAVLSALPSVPVLVAGFSALADVGASFAVISEAEYKKARSEKDVRSTLAKFFPQEGEKTMNLIVKADTRSSLEAILDGIAKLNKKLSQGMFFVVQSHIGNVTEGDVLLAQDSGSFIVGFHVKVENSAGQEARRASVNVFSHTIIYKIFEDLEEYAEQRKEVKMIQKKTGSAEVLKVFNIKKFGVIAGCRVTDGVISAKGKLSVVRNGEVIGKGPIKTLQRDKKTVKEVHAGFECAFLVDGFEDWKEGDIAEGYLEVPEGK